MRRMAGLVVTLLLILTCAMSLALGTRTASAQGPGGGMPMGGGRPGGGMGPGGAPIDSFAAERDSLLDIVKQHYADKLEMPADSVFKNIKLFKGVPAKFVLGAMGGWGHALGVRCQHCHVLGHWADDDKKPKQAARDMAAMVGKINDELLPAVKGLQSEHPHVGCFTCHHGTARPGARPAGMGGPGGPGGPGGGMPQGGGDHH